MGFSAATIASEPPRESRTSGCQEHGVYEAFRVDRAISSMLVRMTGREPVEWTGCPACRLVARLAAEREARERLAAAPEVLQQMTWAGVPERFRAATFEGFDPSDPDPAIAAKKAAALLKARSYAANFRARLEAGSALLFSGGPGTGKTHLAVAIVRAAVEAGHSVRYTTVQTMIGELLETWKTQELESRVLARFLSPDLLVVDEIGAQRPTDVALEKILSVFDGRYGRKLPVVAVSNLPFVAAREGGPSPWAEALGTRVLDRLRENGGTAVVFDWPSQRRKKGSE